MKITLDRVALRALIDADPEFELELKAAVISEVGRRFFEKDAKRVISAAEPELFAQALKALQDDEDQAFLVRRSLADAVVTRGSWSTPPRVSPEVQAQITNLVEIEKERLTQAAATAISKGYSDVIQKAVDEKLSASDIDALIEKRVNRLADEEIERRAMAHFNKLKARVASALS